MSYQNFANRWIGGRVDFDGSYGYQCVDFIRQYLKEEAGASNTGGVAGATDYWYSTPAGVLAVCDKVSTKSPQAGDIVILSGLSGNTYGHITLASGNTSGSTYEALEQNGATGNGSGTGADAVRYRYITTSRIIGVLRPKTASAPAPTPSPATGKRVYLPAVPAWRLYNEGGPYTVGHEKATLVPSKFNGLNYEVLGSPVANVVIIQTQQFGRGAIYVGPGTGAVIQ